MNEWVFAVLTVVNVISLALIFVIYHNMISMKLHITQSHTGLATILGRIMAVEATLVRMATGLTDLVNTTGEMLDRVDGPTRPIFKTSDGKYVASSIDELISKMKGDKKSSEYFSDEEVDKLRKLFEPDDDIDDIIDDLDELEDK